MANLLVFLAFIFSINVYSFEIHCDTDQEDIDLVLKRSEKTNLSYVLLFTPDDLLEYYILENSGIVNESGESFTYQVTGEGDEEFILLNNNSGTLSIPFKKAEISLIKNCIKVI